METLGTALLLWSAAFALPPPPAASPAAPGPTRPPSRLSALAGPFIIFFDQDRSDVTHQAAVILDNVAAAWRSSDSVLVTLAGHSDSAGPADDNLALSRQRADNVKSYLAARGIPEAAMSSVGFGEQNPLVETANGVREPQNRNVQIFFRPQDRR